MSTKKEVKIQQYFRKFPVYALSIILCGLLCLFVEPILGTIALIVGTCLVFWKKRRISDYTFDRLLEDHLSVLEATALEKLRLDHSELVHPTQSIRSPKFWNLGHANLHFRKGKDNIFRYSPIDITLIFFTQHKLCLYQCNYDLITTNPLNVSSKKYFYADVVSIETRSISRTILEKDIKKEVFEDFPHLMSYLDAGKLQINQCEQFVLTTRGGNTLEIQLPELTILNNTINGSLSRGKADEAIAAVEVMLDNKKKISH